MAIAILVLLVLPIFQASAVESVAEEPAVSEEETAKDILIIDTEHRFAYFGWHKASQMPLTGWDLLNRTLAWATSRSPPNETRIVFFTYDGTYTPTPENEDAACVYDWLASFGYIEENIDLQPLEMAQILPSTYYDDFGLVLYWNVEYIESMNIVASGVPFVTVCAVQSEEMGIGTGVPTTYEEKSDFYVVNNDYYPTQTYPIGQLLFESAMVVDATDATEQGRVLVKAEVESVCPQVEMSLTEDVTVSEAGNASISYVLTIPEGPLADMYLKGFFTEPPTDPEVEVPLPEDTTEPVTVELEGYVTDLSLTGDMNGDGKVDIKDVATAAVAFGSCLGHPRWNCYADINEDGKIDIRDIATIAKSFGSTTPPPPEMTVPVKDSVHEGIALDHEVLLGFGVVPVDSKITPRDINNETRISVNCYAPQLATLNDSVWQIKVGPQDETAANQTAEYMFLNIEFIEQMLRMLQGDQVLLSNWVMRIRLPTGAEFLNMDALNGLTWTIDYGEGTYTESNLTATSTEVIITETMVVTEHGITAAIDDLWTAVCQYKVFHIDYRLGSFSSEIPIVKEPCTSGTDCWEKTWSRTLAPGTKAFSRAVDSKLTATVKVTPYLELSWRLYYCKSDGHMNAFQAKAHVGGYVEVYAEASAQVSYSKYWEAEIGTVSKTFWFWHKALWMWVELKLEITGQISVQAYGTVSHSYTTKVSMSIDVGINWSKYDGWSGIWYPWWSTSITGPRISGSAGCDLSAAAIGRLKLYFYSIGGPFLELNPWVPVTIRHNPNTWDVYLNLRIVTGVQMAGWIRDLMNLPSWSWVPCYGTIWHWWGTW